LQAACFNNPCLNRGICESFNETVYFCACPAYFTGQRCETAVPSKTFFHEIYLYFNKFLCFFLDPCIGKNCGPYGECRDNQGVALCYCNDGLHLDGSPCQGKDKMNFLNIKILFIYVI
jgi:hypothetical protein